MDMGTLVIQIPEKRCQKTFGEKLTRVLKSRQKTHGDHLEGATQHAAIDNECRAGDVAAGITG